MAPTTVGALLAAGALWSAGVPQTQEALWASVDAESAETPLDVEILKTWEQDAIVLHMVRFAVGVHKGRASKLAGHYAYPNGGRDLPALVQTNGGGQIASTYGPLKWARLGYACFNPNNGSRISSITELDVELASRVGLEFYRDSTWQTYNLRRTGGTVTIAPGAAIPSLPVVPLPAVGYTPLPLGGALPAQLAPVCFCWGYYQSHRQHRLPQHRFD